jgi:hypothetical protein
MSCDRRIAIAHGTMRGTFDRPGAFKVCREIGSRHDLKKEQCVSLLPPTRASAASATDRSVESFHRASLVHTRGLDTWESVQHEAAFSQYSCVQKPKTTSNRVWRGVSAQRHHRAQIPPACSGLRHTCISKISSDRDVLVQSQSSSPLSVVISIIAEALSRWKVGDDVSALCFHSVEQGESLFL